MPETMLLLILVPVAAAALMLLLDLRATAARARWTALFVSLGVLGLSAVLAGACPERAPDSSSGAGTAYRPRLEWRQPWFRLGGTAAGAGAAEAARDEIVLEFHLGVDGIGVSLIVLTAVLTVSAVLISWRAVVDRPAEFYAALLVLQGCLNGVFCACDLLLFYVFFEFTLVPLYLLIGRWGGPDRNRAAVKFFVYTLAGSLVTLLGLVALVWQVHRTTGLETPFSIPALARALSEHPLPVEVQVPIFLALSAGFLIKVPLVPFHTWLPLAHVEAPTAGSVMLAGVLLKLGSYGFLRLCLTLLPAASLQAGRPLMAGLAVAGIVYGSLCALAQNDVKRLVAYSSVAHLGFCLLGLFALNAEGIGGGVLQMVNHGLSTGALFLIVGMLYERYHTRRLTDLGGLARRLPRIAVGLVFVSLASIGLPGLNGFTGEFLGLIGMFRVRWEYAALGATGVVLGAWYMLEMLQRAFFGELKEPDLHGEPPPHDLSVREFAALAPLCAACLWIGLFPQTVLDVIRPDVDAVAQLYADGTPAGESTETATVFDGGTSRE